MIRTSDNNSYVNQNPVVAEAATRYVATSKQTITFDFFNDGGYNVTSAKPTSGGIQTFNINKEINGASSQVDFIGTFCKFTGATEANMAQIGNSSSDTLGDYYSVAGDSSVASGTKGHRAIIVNTIFNNVTKIATVSASANANDECYLSICSSNPNLMSDDYSSRTYTRVANDKGKNHNLSYELGSEYEGKDIAIAIDWYRSGSSVKVTSSFTLEITFDSLEDIPATGISLENEFVEAFVGDKFKIVPTLTPANSNSEITWSSNSPTIASIDENNGEITCLNEGEAVITAKVSESIYAQCTVKVSSIHTTSVNFDLETMNVEVWDTFKTEATVLPENTTDDITYTSSDETIATVENGVVTTLKEGEVTITCESGEFSDEIKLNIVSGTLSLSSSSDFDYAKDASDYYANGFKMFYNKSTSGRAQIKDIEFYTAFAGEITVNYRETGNNKNRTINLFDINGTSLGSHKGPEDQSDQEFIVYVPQPGFYSIKNIVTGAEGNDNGANIGVSNLINLNSISFIKSDAQLNYQYNNDSTPTAVRFIGTLSNVTDTTVIDTITLTFKSGENEAVKTINTIWESVNVSADGDDKGATFEKTDNTYYVVYSVTDISGALETEFSVTLTVTFTEASGLETMSVNRTFVLGE